MPQQNSWETRDEQREQPISHAAGAPLAEGRPHGSEDVENVMSAGLDHEVGADGLPVPPDPHIHIEGKPMTTREAILFGGDEDAELR